MLTVIEVIGDHAALLCGPGLVRRYGLDRPVSSGDLQLSQQGQAVAILRAPALEPEPPAIPAVAQQHLDVVLADGKQIRDVEGLIAQPV